MKPLHLAAAAATAIALLAGGSASAAVYSLNDYSAAFSPPLGSVTVTGQGTQTLSFDVSLADNVYFQQLGNGGLHDAFWFDLSGLVGGTSVTYNITAPNGPAAGADFPTGGLFTGANFSSAGYGQGTLMGAHYAVQVSDSSKPINYYHGDPVFTVTGGAGSHLDVAAITGKDFAGADLRECSNADCTTVLATGPVGATPGVPEPATWGMMILGFGGVGALMRRRRPVMALAAA